MPTTVLPITPTGVSSILGVFRSDHVGMWVNRRTVPGAPTSRMGAPGVGASSARALVVLVCATLLTGCVGEDNNAAPTPPASSTPQQEIPEISNVWHKTAAFDPASSLGTFVRAYDEAMHLPANTVESRFPGTTEASKWPYQAMRMSVESDSYYIHAPQRKGTQDHYVLWASRSGDTIDVGICTSSRRLATRDEDGSWYRNEGSLQVSASRMWITTTGTPPQQAAKGPGTFAFTDVYGDWTVSRYDIVADDEFGKQAPTQRPTKDACFEQLGIDPHTTPGLKKVPVVGEPVVEPNSPGWPTLNQT